ncbi:MAG: 3-isopropylmalate dehydratase small subunit [Candidatus Bathyarchaeia archaeon]
MKNLIVKGKVWKFGDNINTDLIIAGKYKYDTLDMKEMAKHAFEAIRPEFAKLAKEGDIIVAGRNLGAGSSREQAPLVLKALGIKTIVAESFARIFFRNAINSGLLALECNGISTAVDEGDVIQINLTTGTIENTTKKVTLKFKPLPKLFLDIFNEGGLVPYVKKHGGIKL